MPMAALDGEGKRLTARDFSPLRWDEMRLRGRRRRAVLFCQWCHSPMHPVRNQWGTPFFAHNPGSSCPDAKPQSAAHLTIKDNLVVSIKGVPGWHASVEEPMTLSDGLMYVADVVAHPVTPKKAPWVYEVQVSDQTEEVTAKRHEERIRGHGRCTWVTTRRRSWSTRYPSCQVASDRETVIGGIWKDLDEEMEPTPLGEIMSGFLTDRLSWLQGYGFMPLGAWSSAVSRPRPVLRPSGRFSATGDHIEDYCRNAPGALSRFWSPETVATWDDDDWFLKARMAQVTLAAGKPINEVEAEAIRRWPKPIGLLDPLPSDWK